jgi:hypothetical protein
MVFPARQMIFNVIGDLVADRRQRNERGRRPPRLVSDTWPLDLADSQANPCPTISMS